MIIWAWCVHSDGHSFKKSLGHGAVQCGFISASAMMVMVSRGCWIWTGREGYALVNQWMVNKIMEWLLGCWWRLVLFYWIPYMVIQFTWDTSTWPQTWCLLMYKTDIFTIKSQHLFQSFAPTPLNHHVSEPWSHRKDTSTSPSPRALCLSPSGVEHGEDQKPGGVEVGLHIEDKDAFTETNSPGSQDISVVEAYGNIAHKKDPYVCMPWSWCCQNLPSTKSPWKC